MGRGCRGRRGSGSPSRSAGAALRTWLSALAPEIGGATLSEARCGFHTRLICRTKSQVRAGLLLQMKKFRARGLRYKATQLWHTKEWLRGVEGLPTVGRTPFCSESPLHIPGSQPGQLQPGQLPRPVPFGASGVLAPMCLCPCWEPQGPLSKNAVPCCPSAWEKVLPGVS